jgi:hypothetical protein
MDKRIYELALHAANRTAPTDFSYENVETALREEFRKMAGSVNEFMRNRYDIYDIIIKTADSVMPRKALDIMGQFAEIQSVPQGTKAIFRTRTGKMRARKFLTQVGLSGVYEAFRLDNKTFELNMGAIGGAATIDFCRYLDGAEDMAELMDIIVEGLSDAVFIEVQKALRASLNAVRPASTVYSDNAWNSDHMFALCNVVRAYGQNAVIFAPPEFVAAMGPDAIVPVGTYGTSYPAVGVYHPQDIDAIHNTGYVNLFRGTPIVQIPQSFVDENNDKVWIDPSIAYVLPTGGEKVVKVVLEGETQIKDHENYDNSMEIHVWKKMGCGILSYNNWGIYKNEAITSPVMDNPYGI